MRPIRVGPALTAVWVQALGQPKNPRLGLSEQMPSVDDRIRV